MYRVIVYKSRDTRLAPRMYSTMSRKRCRASASLERSTFSEMRDSEAIGVVSFKYVRRFFQTVCKYYSKEHVFAYCSRNPLPNVSAIVFEYSAFVEYSTLGLQPLRAVVPVYFFFPS